MDFQSAMETFAEAWAAANTVKSEVPSDLSQIGLTIAGEGFLSKDGIKGIVTGDACWLGGAMTFERWSAVEPKTELSGVAYAQLWTTVG